MSKSAFRASKKTIGGVPCAELPSGELTLSGRYGDIWVYSESPELFRAVYTRHRSHDVLSKPFPRSELRKWMRKLQIPTDPGLQAEHAKNFGKDNED
jgi:hypothetical protein